MRNSRSLIVILGYDQVLQGKTLGPSKKIGVRIVDWVEFDVAVDSVFPIEASLF